MAPKGRQKARRVHQESDYDTDGLATEVALKQYDDETVAAPVVQPRSNEELNLSVLKRQYPDVSQVLSVAPFAVVYAFSPESQTWEKTGVEGTLFVCQMAPTQSGTQVIERYSVVVLNRKGLFNYATELTSSNNVEVTAEYVILQVNDDTTGLESVVGLWIFSEPEPSSTARTREINAQIIVECATRADKSRAALRTNTTGTNGGLQSVASQAQDYSIRPRPVAGPSVQSHPYTLPHGHGHHLHHGSDSAQQHGQQYQQPPVNGQSHIAPHQHPHGHYNPMQHPGNHHSYPQQTMYHPMGHSYPQQTSMSLHYPPPIGSLQSQHPSMPQPGSTPQQYQPQQQQQYQAQPPPPQPQSQPNILLNLFQTAQRG